MDAQMGGRCNLCGIIGVAATSLWQADVKAFNDLLYIDTVRGFDSTGVALIPTQARRRQLGDVIVHKRALAGPEFIDTRKYRKVMASAAADYTCMIGHNRAATRGAVRDDTAHPFTHRNVTLVHNGTLNSYHKLAPAGYADVDSQAIAYIVGEANGHDEIVEAIEQIEGAFALVWYDSNTNMLYFVRNKERPMCMAPIMPTSGAVNQSPRGLIWASEAAMIQFAASRNSIRIGEIEQLPVGELRGYEIGNAYNLAVQSSVEVYEPVKKTIVVTGNTQRKTGNSGYGAAGSTTKLDTNQLNNPGLPKRGDYADFMFVEADYQPYQHKPGSGILQGRLRTSNGQVVTVKVHQAAPPGKTNKGGVYRGRVNELYVSSDVLPGCTLNVVINMNIKCVKTQPGRALTMFNPNKFQDVESITPEMLRSENEKKQQPASASSQQHNTEDDEDTAVLMLGPSRRLIDYKDWLDYTKHGCCICTCDLTEDMADDIEWLNNAASPICPDCSERMEKQAV